MTGTIIKIREEAGYGFIAVDGGGPNIFFHITSLDTLEFNQQLLERRVEFDVRDSDKGPRAVFVRAAD